MCWKMWWNVAYWMYTVISHSMSFLLWLFDIHPKSPKPPKILKLLVTASGVDLHYIATPPVRDLHVEALANDVLRKGWRACLVHDTSWPRASSKRVMYFVPLTHHRTSTILRLCVTKHQHTSTSLDFCMCVTILTRFRPWNLIQMYLIILV